MKRVFLVKRNSFALHLLLVGCFMTTLSLGQTTDSSPKSSIGTLGAAVFVIETVEKGKGAEKAGLKIGDTILEVNEQGFSSLGQFNSLFSTNRATEIRLSQINNGKRGSRKVMLQNIASYNDLGAIGTLGLFVRKVHPDSPASNAGFQSGDVILEVDGKPFSSLNDVNELLIMREAGTQLTLKVQRLDESGVHRYSLSIKTVPFSAIPRQ